MLCTGFIYCIGLSGFFVEIRGGVTLYLAFLMTFMGTHIRVFDRQNPVVTGFPIVNFVQSSAFKDLAFLMTFMGPPPLVGSEGRRGRWGTPTMALHI